MDENKINGDSKVVMGTPVSTENNIEIPPQKIGEKVIEEGTIEISLEPNTKELIEALNRQTGGSER